MLASLRRFYVRWFVRCADCRSVPPIAAVTIGSAKEARLCGDCWEERLVAFRKATLRG